MSSGDLLTYLADLLRSRRYEFGFVAGAVLLELLLRSRFARRLLSRGYLLDLTYCAIYRFGIYAVLLDRPINDFVFSHLTWHLMFGAPVWLRVVGYLFLLDFTNYWIHRVEHSVPALWAFHQVHHSQEQLSIMATYRNHPLDIWLRGFVGPAVFMVIFGVPPIVWFPLSLFWDVTLNLSHLEVGWTYGPLRWLLVSPVSHSIHHSVEDRHQHRNFGANLAIWDRLFGTADIGTERPTAVGLPGWQVRESMLAHCWAPIRGVARYYRGLPEHQLAPLHAPNTTAKAEEKAVLPA